VRKFPPPLAESFFFSVGLCMVTVQRIADNVSLRITIRTGGTIADHDVDVSQLGDALSAYSSWISAVHCFLVFHWIPVAYPTFADIWLPNGTPIRR
jgi:hypothetical protein